MWDFEREADDVVYLPCTEPRHRARRDEKARQLVDRGLAVWLQLLPGEERPPVGLGLLDLSPILLGECELDELGGDLPDDAIWPLVPSLSDRDELVESLGGRLAEAGVKSATVVLPQMTAKDRRRLSEGRGDEVFDALFHGPQPSEWRLMDRLTELGLAPFSKRPVVPGGAAFALRRSLAGRLAEAGEWQLRKGESGSGQAHLRAARHLDSSTLDLVSVYRDGNLSILEWLGEASRELVEEALAEYASHEMKTSRSALEGST